MEREGAHHGHHGMVARRDRGAGNVGSNAHSASGEAGAGAADLAGNACCPTSVTSGAGGDLTGPHARAAGCPAQAGPEAGRQEGHTQEGSGAPAGEEGGREARGAAAS
jgi:hypothetical protein